MASEAAAASVGDRREGPDEPARPCGILRRLSSAANHADAFLEARPFERANWLPVGFAAGIALWLALPGPWQWTAALCACAAAALLALAPGPEAAFPWLRTAAAAMALMILAGCAAVWSKSELVGAPAIERPMAVWLTGRIERREDQPAQGRVRLVLRGRIEGEGEPSRVRINLPLDDDAPGLREGAEIRLRVRLMPPASPMLPGSYDFARAAWFAGLSATGSALGPPRVLTPGAGGDRLLRLRHALSDHVQSRLGGSAGGIATAFASGERGAIAPEDEAAMRDAGLTHLLSISGLHVSAVVGAAYVLAIRLLALWPWLALRVRLPVVAAGTGALAGIGYTLLTGAEVPTVRSCIGAVLVLFALALGRDPLSLRMVAVAALFVMLLWPEAVLGPSFQMSFGAVVAIVALHGAEPLRRFAQGREEPAVLRLGRSLALLLLTGVVIELALLPTGLFHFHRAGVYGALANVVAIPLTTFATMPLIALALLLDLAGIGAPAWWAVGKSLELLLALAHFTARQPGAVTLLPAMGAGHYLLFLSGGLWLALWSGPVRLWGLLPVAIGVMGLAFLRPPDVLVTGDGRYVGVTGEGPELLLLREGRGDYVRENLQEIAGMSGEVRTLAEWPGAQCNRDFCSLVLTRQGRRKTLLVSRGRDAVDEFPLAAACERADIVVADRWLPRSCRPRWFKADRAMLSRTGGLAIDLSEGTVTTVSQSQGRHGWYRWPQPQPRRRRPAP